MSLTSLVNIIVFRRHVFDVLLLKLKHMADRMSHTISQRMYNQQAQKAWKSWSTVRAPAINIVLCEASGLEAGLAA